MSSPNVIDGLQNLMCFVRVVEAGSFAEAARRAGTTTSAMSKAIARFEQAHGMRLLHRTTHTLSLTPEGERLLEGARDLLAEAERLQASLCPDEEAGAGGHVRIAAPAAFIRACLLPALPDFLRQNTGLHLDLRPEDSMADLGPGGIDLAIRIGRPEEQPDTASTRLLSFPWLLCGSLAYLNRHGCPSSPKDLSGHEQIGVRHSSTGLLQAWLFADPSRKPALSIARHMPTARLVTEDPTLAWGMVRDGLGLGWAPGWLAADDLRNGTVVELLRDWRTPEMRLSALWRERRRTPRRIQLAIDWLTGLAPDWASPR